MIRVTKQATTKGRTMRKRNNAMPSLNIKARKCTPEYVSQLASKLAMMSGGKVGKIAKREAKIETLRKLGTVEARHERKNMNVTWHGKLVPTKVDGFYAGRKGNGNRPLRAKVNSKTRHSLAAAKGIMMPKYSRFINHN